MENNYENEQKQVDESVPVQPKSEEVQPRRKWGPQILGLMIGAFVFMVAGGLASQLGLVETSTNRWWLWGGFIGSFIGSGDSLNKSGKILSFSSGDTIIER